MKTIRTMPERALSWSDEDSNLCFIRGSEGHASDRKMRSQTVDLSTTPGLYGRSLDSKMMDTVFEEDETESKPLLEKNDTTKSAPAGIDSTKKMEDPQQAITTIIPDQSFGDTICIGQNVSKPVAKDGKKAASEKDTEKDENPKLDNKVTRRNSGHVLTRQGAMEDIPMKKVNRSTSQ